MCVALEESQEAPAQRTPWTTSQQDTPHDDVCESTPLNTTPLTYGAFLAFNEAELDGRYEYEEGDVYAMASPAEAHQDMVLALGVQLSLQLRGRRCKPYIAPMDVRFPLKPDTPLEDLGDTTEVRVYQPDVFVVCDPSQRKGTHILGAPDFIIEVLSESSRYRDRIKKCDFYMRHGVREYWMIEIYQRQLVIAQPNTEDRRFYSMVVMAARGIIEAESVGVSINFDELYAEIDWQAAEEPALGAPLNQ